jgi:hypothetical protein
MGLHRNPVLRAQDLEIERGQQRHHRGAGGLMAADLQPVPVRAQMVRVMDDPAGEPEDLAFKLREKGQPLGAARRTAERG